MVKSQIMSISPVGLRSHPLVGQELERSASNKLVGMFRGILMTRVHHGLGSVRQALSTAFAGTIASAGVSRDWVGLSKSFCLLYSSSLLIDCIESFEFAA